MPPTPISFHLLTDLMLFHFIFHCIPVFSCSGVTTHAGDDHVTGLAGATVQVPAALNAVDVLTPAASNHKYTSLKDALQNNTPALVVENHGKAVAMPAIQNDASPCDFVPLPDDFDDLTGSFLTSSSTHCEDTVVNLVSNQLITKRN